MRFAGGASENLRRSGPVWVRSVLDPVVLAASSAKCAGQTEFTWVGVPGFRLDGTDDFVLNRQSPLTSTRTAAVFCSNPSGRPVDWKVIWCIDD